MIVLPNEVDVPTSQTANILLVDDKPENLRLLSAMLKTQGWAVRMLRRGEMVLAAALLSPPDLILLDILMPDMNGYDVCAQLKAEHRTRDIPVIFISALDESINKVKGFEVGGVDYITKPFQAEEVMARVHTHLSLRHLQQRLERQNSQLQHEIEERTRIEKELRKAKNTAEEAQQAAETANRTKSAFMANMSHELRTPLNGILGYAQILKRDHVLSPHQAQAVKIIHESGEHLLSMINEILDLAKLEAGKVELEPIDFQIRHMLDSLVAMMRPRAVAKGLDFCYNSSVPSGLCVFGDSKRLRQVLHNLLSNAIKFTSTGRVSLSIKSTQVKNPRGQEVALRCSLSDTGPGIPADMHAAIFRPFEQVGDTLTKSDGAGLGLAISAQIVGLMGGELHVKSEPEQGSRFWFEITLPVQLLPLSSSENSAPMPAITGVNGPAGKILVIDDSEENRDGLLEILATLGILVAGARTGREAVEQTRIFRPDLMLIDLNMPNMDGCEAIKRINALSPSLPIIAISAGADSSVRERVREAGCADFLAKPFRVETLLRTIANYMPVEWRYEPLDDSVSLPVTTQESVVLPSGEQLEVLRNAALIGDIVEIRERLLEMRRHDPALKPFIERLQQLCETYRIDVLQEELDAYMSMAHQLRRNGPNATSLELDLRETLTSMPDDWRARFREGVESANFDLVIALIYEIRPQHPDFADMLTDLTQQYRFDVLETMLPTLKLPSE